MSFAESVRALVTEANAAWGALLAAAIVLVATPLAGRVAHRVGAVDAGGDRPRIHTGAVPRIGGLAIALGILVPALVLVGPDGRYGAILLGAALVAVVGLVDDVRGIEPWQKLAAVAAASLVPVVGAGVLFDHVTLPVVGDHDIGWAAYPLTVLWITGLANVVNLIDGMDALAAGIVAIASASFALLAISFGRVDAAVLSAIVFGAAVAFLRHNYHPARMFMGDTGSLTLGFLLGALSVEGVFKTAAALALALPLLVLAVPLLDTSFVVLKRLKYGRAPWRPDQNHLYHRFLRIGLSQRRTAALLHAWAFALAAYAVLLRFVPPRPLGRWDAENVAVATAAGLAVLALSVWMAVALEILKARHVALIRRVPGRGSWSVRARASGEAVSDDDADEAAAAAAQREPAARP